MAVSALVVASVALFSGGVSYPPESQVTRGDIAVVLTDWALVPLSSTTRDTYPPPINYREALSRVSVMRFEPAKFPGAPDRAFVADLNRSLSILNRESGDFVTYINFEEVFPKFVNRSSLGTGFVTFAFDPAYGSNGRIYTVHIEGPSRPGPAEPTNALLPGLDLSGGYAITPSVDPPEGTIVRHAVLVEWTDADPANDTFEGTAREVLRIGFNFSNHAVGDILFGPSSGPADDYGNLYVAVGDGGSGTADGQTEAVPQRLDALPGKILRITPDTSLRPLDAIGGNGRYRIPTSGDDPNPFVSSTLPGVRPEIFAYGLRNPQRMSWDPVTGTVIVADIGLASWEELNILRKGANYGYPRREGSEQLWIGGPNDRKTGSQAVPPTPFPDPDTLTVDGVPDPVVPRYPVAAYSHRDGDAIAGGFVYRGTRLPDLRGKYIFGDITTGRLMYADLGEMLAADDGDPASMAAIRELQIVFDSSRDTLDRGAEPTRLFDLVAAEYASRGGTPADGGVLPGAANHMSDGVDPDGIVYGGGRADIRFAVDPDGELYVLSKSDAMIRLFDGSFPRPPSVPEYFAVSITVAGSGTGRVSTVPVGLSCRDNCSAGFVTGTAVTLVPQADTLSAFAGWSDACSGSGECRVTASAFVTATFVESTPDLSAAVTAMPEAGTPGGKIMVTETTANGGGAAAATSTTRYYLSSDTAKGAGDVVLGSRSVTALEAGVSSTATPSVTLSSTTPLGVYYIIACADDTMRVPELQEQNNCGASQTTLTVTRADLSQTAVSNPPSAVAPGGAFSVTDTVTNRGGYTAGASTNRYYLSADAFKTTNDRLLTGSRSVAALAPGASSMGTKTVTVPVDMPLGTHVLLACADDLAKVAELDESNNCVASSGMIVVGRPDLVTSSVTNPPAEIAPGKTFSVTAATLNQGGAPAAASTTRYYFSLDDHKSSSDVLLTGTRAVGGLAPGASSSGARTVTVPASAPAGAYRLLACSDDLVVVAEHNETNNCASAAAVVHVRLPDLAQLTVSDPPPDLSPGMTFTVTDSVRNIGDIGVSSTSTRYYLSADAVKSAEDVLLTGARSVSSLAVGVTNTGSRNLAVPTGAATGMYYLLACADGGNAVAESREENNCGVAAARTTIR